MEIGEIRENRVFQGSQGLEKMEIGVKLDCGVRTATLVLMV